MYKVFMTRRFLILLVVLIFFALRCYPQNINNDDKLRDIVGQNGQVEVTIPYTDNKALDNLTRNVSILSVRNKIVSISLSPLTVEWFILQKYDYVITKKTDNKGVISALDINQAMEWDKYPTYSQYDSIMQSFKILYPALCHLDTIGTSVNGKLVLTLKISDNIGTDEDEPEVFYSSTMHGDETGGFVLMLRLADYLLKNYNLNSRVKNLVDNLEIWINPLANPDGTYRTGNTISSPTRFNANGVDLNRNFPDPFQPLEIQQKENRDMIKFMRKHNFVISANFHSGSEVVNYPWDRWFSKLHADDSWFNSISRAYADTVHVYSGPAYMNELDNGVTRGAAWYIIYGGRQDFVTYELQGREVTIELDDQLITPVAQLSLLWQNNWRSLIGYLENALYGIHGLVRNASTSAPVLAKVFISGHDKDSSQVYSDILTGSFVRLLAPGSWNLTFSATGYHDTTVSNIIVASGLRTDIIVNMVPIINNIDTTNPEAPILYPNPATTELSAVLPERIMGNISIRIFNQAGTIFSDYITEAIQGVPVKIDVKRLSGGIYSVVFTNTFTKNSCRGRFIVIK
ncbi:MAG: M14 family zinc carboxypeptidase [Bacteroidia bacterium]|nr:M14 family zinc carboxypeptidase [Bacteroidia bacterium]